MQIGNRVIQNYDANIKNGSKLENAKASEQTSQTQSSSVISALKEGAVFKGEVLNIIGDRITLSLEDKAQLFARLQEDIQLGVGDQLLFSVKENNANQVLIKPLFDSLYSAQTQVLEKALDVAGLSPTEKNFSAAKELMDAGMPVDKANMVKLLSQSMKFEGTSMQTLVGLNKMNIPVTEGNITQYERYQGYQHQLTGDIATAADGISSFTQAFPEGTTGSELLSVATQILDIFTSEQSIDGGTVQNIENHNLDVQEMPLTSGQQITDVASIIGEQNVSGEQSMATNEQAVLMHSKDIVLLEHSQQDIKVDDTMKPLQQNMVEAFTEEVIKDNDTEAKYSVSLSKITENTGLTKEGIQNLTGLLSKTGITAEQMQTLFQNSNSPEELLKNMLQQLATTGGSDKAIRDVLDSNEWKDMLSEVIKKNWSLNPKDMKEPKEIDQLYERIIKQSKSIENLISSSGGESKHFEQNFQNMRQNMQFMEQINQQMIYAQMPLKLNNQNANSELYVYADKRKLAQKQDDISVMLHLDMDHLGKTDVHVTLTGTNVNARFYLDDQTSVDIVTENINQLAKQLSDRGFSLTNEVVKRQPQESINKVVDEIIDENAERSIKRYTFDART